ncbi:hypothetical protein BOTBODRAFT_145314 [Botryobasidium botryosum FD-172 SS1]|uniref:Uncharacterized protein n=1 Tax=Botryobasidium botryosum (strain FD-172 SS1) TaxID=930990 RepID=A0A067MGS2_BOTB1|nr:hypothetical protein BOTBODRAFT_145314 [Botryobasidium botryosum FD-172 SS1]
MDASGDARASSDQQAIQLLQGIWPRENDSSQVARAEKGATERVVRGLSGKPKVVLEVPGEKKPTMSIPEPGRPMPCIHTRRPFSIALDRIKNFKWMGLWFFTREGLNAAMLNEYPPEGSYIPDHLLTWRQLETSQHTFFALLERYEWPKSNITMLRTFFMNLSLSTHHLRPHGECVLLAYQAQVRREWHESLELDGGFDISLISEARLQNIRHEILSEVQYEPTARECTPPANFSGSHQQLRQSPDSRSYPSYPTEEPSPPGLSSRRRSNSRSRSPERRPSEYYPTRRNRRNSRKSRARR